MQPSEQIKEKLNVVDVLKGYLELKPAGRNFKARCPFHNEKTPSFIVSPDRQIWHCFGCGVGGDIFKFVMDYENVEFYEALKVLAEKAGIELRSLSSGDYRQFGILYEINSEINKFYQANLKNNQKIIDYLLKRGFNMETINEFEIGFAPDVFDASASYLMKKGYKIDDIMRAGIIFRTDKGKYGDRLRGRIIFPIHNHFGKVVGFTGRILPEADDGSTGKYINSPETPVFNKSKILYGFWRSKQPIRESGTVVLVEGQADFLLAWQAGVKNVVATSGTALTPEHLKVLRKIADKVVIAYDNDDAGHMAAERAMDLLGSADFLPMIVDLGDYKDPADAAEADAEFLKNAVSSPKPAIEYYFNRYLGKEERKEGIRKILQKINKLYSAIDRSDWLRELSHRTGISEPDLREELSNIEPDAENFEKKSEDKNKKDKSKPTRWEILAMQAIGLALRGESFKGIIEEKVEFMPNRMQMAYNHIFDKGPKAPYPENEIKRLVDYINLKYAGTDESDESEIEEQEVQKLLDELELEYLKLKTVELKNHIRAAELKKDEIELQTKLKEFDSISRRMQDIRKNKA